MYNDYNPDKIIERTDLMKNYYKILEIDKDASKEVIEKAYKTLVKKYHPDLQPEDKKSEAEEKIKLINEAYELLSDDEKRAQYNSQLEQDTISKEKYAELLHEKENLKHELNNLKMNVNQTSPHPTVKRTLSNAPKNINNPPSHTSSQTSSSESFSPTFDTIRDNLAAAYNQAYHDAYVQDLRNRGYKIRYKKTFKDYLKNFIAILIMIFIIFMLWMIPFTKNWLLNFYNSNEILKFIVDFFINLFTSFFDSLKNLGSFLK